MGLFYLSISPFFSNPYFSHLYFHLRPGLRSYPGGLFSKLGGRADTYLLALPNEGQFRFRRNVPAKLF